MQSHHYTGHGQWEWPFLIHSRFIRSLVKKKSTNLSFLFPVPFCSCCFSVFFLQSFFFPSNILPISLLSLNTLFCVEGTHFICLQCFWVYFCVAFYLLVTTSLPRYPHTSCLWGCLLSAALPAAGPAGREGKPHGCKQNPSGFHCWQSCVWKEELWLLFLSSQKESCNSSWLCPTPPKQSCCCLSEWKSWFSTWPSLAQAVKGTTQLLIGFDER